MRTVKTIFLAVFGLLCSQVALAQTHEEAAPAFVDKTDPAKYVQLFPNPATDYVNVKFEQPRAKKIKLSMSTIIGNSLDLEVEAVDDYELRIKVRDLPSGYYLLAIHDEDARVKNTYKFLKR